MNTIILILAGIGLLNVIGFTVFLFILMMETWSE